MLSKNYTTYCSSYKRNDVILLSFPVSLHFYANIYKQDQYDQNMKINILVFLSFFLLIFFFRQLVSYTVRNSTVC